MKNKKLTWQGAIVVVAFIIFCTVLIIVMLGQHINGRISCEVSAINYAKMNSSNDCWYNTTQKICVLPTYIRCEGAGDSPILAIAGIR